MGHRGDQMFILGDLTRVAWHGKVEAKRLAGTLKRKWGFPPVSGNRKEKSQWLDRARRGQNQSQVLRVKVVEEYLGHEEAIFFKPVLKIA